MKVLIVEQNRHILNSLSRYLQSKGHEVNAVFDGVIAFNEFSEDTELLIIDYDVPRISYTEVITLLKKRQPKLKSVVILGNKPLNSDMLIDNQLVDEFIPKPFTYKNIDDLFENLSLDKSGENFYLTYHEFLLLKKLKEEGVISHKEVGKHVHNKEEIYLYIRALNVKLVDKEIRNEEEGFKLVESNV